MHYKKMIAPIVITVIIFVYLILYFLIGLSLEDLPFFAKLMAGVIPACLAGVSIYVLIERIKEIRSGEEDDLGKY